MTTAAQTTKKARKICPERDIPNGMVDGSWLMAGNCSALTPDPSPTLRERGVFSEKPAGAGSPLSHSVGEGSGVRGA